MNAIGEPPFESGGPVGKPGKLTIILEIDGRALARAIVEESKRCGGLPIRIRPDDGETP